MRPLFHRLGLFALGVSLLSLSACSSCDDTTEVVKPAAEDCGHTPDIVRVEFNPKEGRAPLTAAFTVLGEDEDLDVCPDEALLYHWDFDSDGLEDVKPTKSGRNVKHVFRAAGDFRVSMWVTDKDRNASKKIVKFVKVGANARPFISSLYLDSNSGEAPFPANLHWTASDGDGVDDLAKYTLDWGDGTKTTDTEHVSGNGVSHDYRGVGTFKITLRVYDSIGASSQKTIEVIVSTRVLPSNFMQTVGSSQALWLDDNAGAHYAADFGLYDWMLLADGPIGLKVLRYPLDAFSVNTPAERPAELVGMSDPGGTAGTSRDVVGYGTLAVAAGYDGMFVWNYRAAADAPPCTDAWSTNCYPGSPTRPAAYCFLSDSPRFYPAQDFSKLALLKPSGTGEVWAVGANLPGAGEAGGIAGVRLDAAASATGGSRKVSLLPKAAGSYTYDPVTGKLQMNLDLLAWQSLQSGTYQVYDAATDTGALIKAIGYTGSRDNPAFYAVLAPGLAGLSAGTVSVYPANTSYDDCWTNAGLETYQQTSAFQATVQDMQVDGDFAYIGFANASRGGFSVIDLGTGFRLRGLFQSVWNLGDTMPWSVLAQGTTALALTYPREVTGDLAPAAFLSYASLLADTYRSDCNEAQPVNSVANNGATFTITAGAGNDYRAPFGYYAENRLAVRFGDGSVDSNHGLGYRVLSFTGAQTVLEGPAATDPATWSTSSATVYPFGVTAYAILPSYPGRNAVALSGAGAAGLARNGRCLNFLNAYAPVTQSVHVSFTTAPLVFAYILGNAVYQGLYAFDRTDPRNLVQLGPTGPYMGVYSPGFMTWRDDKLYMSSSVVGILDVSDPYHLTEAFYAHAPPDFADDRFVVVGTHSAAAGAPSFELNEIMFLTPPTNPQGVILTADGPLGVGALYVDELLHSTYTSRDTGTIPHNCLNDYWESACLSYLPDLQVRHEGYINQIALVENRYALIAQNYGGVLVFDVSGVASAGDPTFVAHIRTAGTPLSLKYVTDATQKTLFIADDTSLVKIDDFDPAHLPRTVGSTVRAGYNQGYFCVDAAAGRTFACGGFWDGVQYRSDIFYGNGITLPTTEIKLSISTDDHTCIFDPATPLTPSWVNHLWTDWLGNRLFLFADGPAALIREIVTDGAGHIQLSGGYAYACQWNYLLRAHKLGFYQNRPGHYRRFYTANGAGDIYIWDIDALEDAIASPAYNLAREPNLMGSFDLTQYTKGFAVPVVHISALGPYLFVGAGDTGAWVIDVSNPVTPQLVGRSAIKVAGLQVGEMNAVVYPNDPANAAAGYTYLVLVADNSNRGGILLMRYPQLAPP